VRAIEDIPPVDWDAEFRALTKTPEELAQMIKPEHPQGRASFDNPAHHADQDARTAQMRTALQRLAGETPRAHFGKRKPEDKPAARPRLGPPPAFMPEDYHIQHTEHRAETEGWCNLALKDGMEWRRRVLELEEQLRVANGAGKELTRQLYDMDQRVQLLDSKRQDLEAHLALEMAKAEDAVEVAHHNVAQALKVQARAKEWEERAEEMRDAIAFAIHLRRIYGLGAIEWLHAWNEGDPVANEEFETWREKHGRDGEREAGSAPELHGATVFGRDDMYAMPDALGYKRPRAPTVQSAASTAGAENIGQAGPVITPEPVAFPTLERAYPRPHLMLTTYEGAKAAAAWCKNARCMEMGSCRHIDNCRSDIPAVIKNSLDAT
jgi:hypothetical protein